MIVQTGYINEFLVTFNNNELPNSDLKVNIENFGKRAINISPSQYKDSFFDKNYNYKDRVLRAGVYVSDPAFVEVVNIQPYKMFDNQIKYSLRLKNLNTLPIGEKKIICFKTLFYDIEKTPSNGDSFGARKYVICTASGYIYIHNRGNNPYNEEKEKEYYSQIIYYGKGKELRNLTDDIISSQYKYKNYKEFWENNLSNGKLTPIPVIENDIIKFKVKKDRDKYFLYAKAPYYVPHDILPHNTWENHQYYFKTEITKNGLIPATMDNIDDIYYYNVDFIGKNNKESDDNYQVATIIKPKTAGTPTSPILPADPETEPIDPTNPLAPMVPPKPSTPTVPAPQPNPETEPIDPTNPLAPMVPPKPAPEEPSTPVLPVPKPNPKMPLVTNENQKKKPYDPTFLIVSGLFATAIIFGE